MQRRWYGKAPLCQLQGRRHHLFKRHGTVQLERRKPGVGRRWRDRAQYARRQVAVGVLVEVVNAGRPGPAPQTADGHRGLRGGVMNDYGRHSAEAGELGQHHVDGDSGSHPGVGGVATLLQDPVARRRGQVMARGDHVGVTGYQWAECWYTCCHGTPPSLQCQALPEVTSHWTCPMIAGRDPSSPSPLPGMVNRPLKPVNLPHLSLRDKGRLLDSMCSDLEHFPGTAICQRGVLLGWVARGTPSEARGLVRLGCPWSKKRPTPPRWNRGSPLRLARNDTFGARMANRGSLERGRHSLETCTSGYLAPRTPYRKPRSSIARATRWTPISNAA